MEDDLDDYRPRSPSPFTTATDAEAIEPHFQHREYRGSVSEIPLFDNTRADLGSKARAFSHSTPGHRPLQRNFSNQHSQPLQPPPPPPTHLDNYSFPSNNNPSFTPFTNNQAPPSQNHVMKHEESYEEADEYRPERQQRPVSRNKKVKTEEAENGIVNNAPGVAEGIEVKTKFPVARIKRIMQADEDVGKVAQVTPVAVCKFLARTLLT